MYTGTGTPVRYVELGEGRRFKSNISCSIQGRSVLNKILHLIALDPTGGVLGEERVLEVLRGVRGDDEAAETGRGNTTQAIILLLRNIT
jgi:hypothetical protein